MTILSSQHPIIRKFQETWPIEKLKTMSLEEYTNLDKNSFTYWLERETHKAEGILLYPTVDVELSEKYIIKDHPISVFTVNLNADWQLIHERMLEILY